MRSFQEPDREDIARSSEIGNDVALAVFARALEEGLAGVPHEALSERLAALLRQLETVQLAARK